MEGSTSLDKNTEKRILGGQAMESCGPYGEVADLEGMPGGLAEAEQFTELKT